MKSPFIDSSHDMGQNPCFIFDMQQHQAIKVLERILKMKNPP